MQSISDVWIYVAELKSNFFRVQYHHILNGLLEDLCNIMSESYSLLETIGPIRSQTASPEEQEMQRRAHHEELSLSGALQSPVALLVRGGQLSGLVLQLLQLLELWHAGHGQHR